MHNGLNFSRGHDFQRRRVVGNGHIGMDQRSGTDGDELVKGTDHRDRIRIKPDLFVSLTQRGCDQIGIIGILPSTREGNLVSMMPHRW